MKSLVKLGCFDIVTVDTPEEGYDSVSGEYSPEWEPECTRSTLANSRKGNIDHGKTAIRKGVVIPHEGQTRLDRLAEFYSTHEEDEQSPFEGENIMGGGQLRQDPLLEGLVPMNMGIEGIDPKLLGGKEATHLGVEYGRIGMRTK
jgi:hypothetical protein